MPASAELLELCQAHLKLLRRTFGDVSSVIYLAVAADQDSEPALVPIAQLPESIDLNELLNPMVNRGAALPASDMGMALLASEPIRELSVPISSDSAQRIPGIEAADRMVLPLIHQEVVMGVLVMLRSDRPWQVSEQQYIQAVSSGLAAGCFLDRQNYWLRQRLNTKQTLQGEQSDVFHNLLHQFRNPLTAIGTFGKLMLRRLGQDDPNYKLADGIVRESERLKDLVTDFDATVDLGDADIAEGVGQPPILLPEGDLDAQKPLLPALGRALDLTPQGLDGVVQPLITVTMAAANERQRQFWHSPLDSFSKGLVAIDAQALQEVVANLLDNAFKYTSPQTWIWLLGVLEQDDYLGMVIGDSGSGIPLADQAHLFERHYRGVQAQGNRPGTGLGLAIAKDLISHMGGRIELISPIGSERARLLLPAPLLNRSFTDSGTAFVIWLPRVSK